MTDVVYQINQLVPVGSIMMYSVGIAPDGYLLCDGRAVSRTSYRTLFSIVKTTFGSGDGSTTFNVPDMRDRFPIGAGSTFAISATGGDHTQTLVAHNLPNHYHSGTTNSSGPSSGTGNNGVITLGTYEVGVGGSHSHTFTTSNTTTNGTTPVNNSAFSILNKYLSVFYVIKY